MFEQYNFCGPFSIVACGLYVLLCLFATSVTVFVIVGQTRVLYSKMFNHIYEFVTAIISKTGEQYNNLLLVHVYRKFLAC